MSERRIILPGDPSRRDRLTIHVPRGAVDERPVIGRCLVPGCDRRFYRGEEQAWQRHVGDCARANLDRIRETSLAARMPVFDPATWDPEVAEHMRRVGDRMRREGRWTVNPSEKAGF
jgi:hypothetical protein